jgi:hypothetical protein
MLADSHASVYIFGYKRYVCSMVFNLTLRSVAMASTSSLLTPWCMVFVEMQVKKFPAFTEPQDPSTSLYPEPVKSDPHPHTLFL